MRRLAAVSSWGLVLAVALPLAACSSKAATTAPPVAPSPSPSPSPAITKTEYVSRGNAICAQTNVRMSQLPTPPNTPTMVQAAALLDQEVSILTDTETQLKALPVPIGDGATFADLFTKFDAALAVLKQSAAATHAGNAALFKSLVDQGSAAGEAANAAFIAYGLTACGQS